MLPLDKLPLELRNSSRWVLWRLEDTHDEKIKKTRERCKVPYCVANPGRMAKSNDATTWSTLDAAIAALDKFPVADKYKDEPNAKGLGYTFGPPYFGVDLDKCHDPETNETEPWAADIMRQLPPTYVELSPSGKGFHLWYRCADTSKLPAGHRTEKAEVYSRGRYFTMTFAPIEISLDTITEVDLATAKKIFELIKGCDKKATPILDVRTSSKITRAERDARLFAGDYAFLGISDTSEGDYELIARLAESVKGDAAKIRDLALKLPAHRPKWDSHPTYLDSTIAKVLSKFKLSDSERSVVCHTINAANVRAKKWEWLWPDYVPRAVLVWNFAPKGNGKTTFWNEITACITTARAFPGEVSAINRAPGRVIRLNLEDDMARALVPGLQASGADLKMVEFLDRMSFADTNDVAFSLDLSQKSHVEALKERIQSFPDAALVIVEPINSFKGKAKHIAEDDMRPIFENLAIVARETNVTIIVINHTNKKQVDNVLDKSSGSGAGAFVARCVYYLRVNPEDKNERLFIDAGSNLPVGPAIVFTIESAPEFELDGERFDKVGVVKFKRLDVELKAQDVLDMEQASDKSQARAIEAFLRDCLKEKKDGVPSKQVISEARQNEPRWTPENVRQVFSRLKKKGEVHSVGEKNAPIWKLGVAPPALFEEAKRDF